ncbi:MAG TPA: hypothetical protein VJS63_17810 [Bradyrhizobium sp.]|nr:hypothetical protein [Bradyrhizobium sp.]
MLFLLIFLGIGIQAYQDLSQPGAFDYWKDLYLSPSMSSSPIDNADLGGNRRRALVLRGKIGAASATWFREQLDDAHLKAGDVVVISSPGGDLGQAVIMGEVIRSRGLATAVGTIDPAGQIKPGSCASACVFVYAGGKVRFGVEGSRLGVHRFTATAAGDNPVADTQRVTGMVLNYLTRMGVSPTLVEAMTATHDIRWLDAKEAAAMNLITEPLRGP